MTAGGFVHTTGWAPELLYPGIKTVWGTEYNQLPKLYEKFFTIKTANKRFEKEQEFVPFRAAVIKDEADSVEFQRMTQGVQKEYQMVTFGSGASVTREMVEDDQYNIIQQIPRLMAQSLVYFEETIHHNVLNNALDATVTGADGQNLCTATHPYTGQATGTYSNRPATASDLSQTSLEQAITDIMDFRDGNGERINVKGKKLVVPRGEYFNATKILNTQYKVGSADNDINVLSMLDMELVVTNYLTDPDAWFVITDVPNGLTGFLRREAELERDNEIATQILSFVQTKRMALPGWTDPRGVYGSPGA